MHGLYANNEAVSELKKRQNIYEKFATFRLCTLIIIFFLTSNSCTSEHKRCIRISLTASFILHVYSVERLSVFVIFCMQRAVRQGL